MMNYKFQLLLTGILIIFSAINAHTQVTLPSLFCDNMVLQQNFDVPVWGWAKPGTEISVSGNWSRMPVKTVRADSDGNWLVRLKTFDAGGPYEVYINEITIKNIMIGEVWICSGQSNMQWALKQSYDGEKEIDKAIFPDIRFFYVARDNADEPGKDCYGKWVECTPESARSFSAVAYYFGKEIYQELNVPVGLIHVSWGGSTVQAWINYNILQSTPEGKFYIEQYKEKCDNMEPGILPRNMQSPSGLYNGMLKPLIPYAMKGVIWYQGEANVDEHYMYKNLMNMLISSWRSEWGQGEFPFYFVQLAPYNYTSGVVGAAMRDVQRRSLVIPNTGMAITMDIGIMEDIHPRNKKEVGKRLSKWALAETYGKKDIVYSGPLYKSMKTEGRKIRVFFDHIGSGLACIEDRLTRFTIAGEDKIFYPATAELNKNSILVSSKSVKNPVAVRYAFNNGDEPSLFNNEGLPASTFRTDDWPVITDKPMIESTFDPETKDLVLSMETPRSGEIRFTLNGLEPGKNSELYNKPFHVKENSSIKAKVFVDGEPSLVTSETQIVRHLAVGAKVTYLEKYDNRYTGGGDFGLVNCMFGTPDFKDGNWQGFQGKDMEVILDLGSKQVISEVLINALQVVDSWIILPKYVKIYSSVDGLNFNHISTIKHGVPPGVTKKLIHEFKAGFNKQEARYLKVVAKNYGQLPEWHLSAGNDSWIFIDEIIIE